MWTPTWEGQRRTPSTFTTDEQAGRHRQQSHHPGTPSEAPALQRRAHRDPGQEVQPAAPMGAVALTHLTLNSMCVHSGPPKSMPRPDRLAVHETSRGTPGAPGRWCRRPGRSGAQQKPRPAVQLQAGEGSLGRTGRVGREEESQVQDAAVGATCRL